MRKTMKVVTIAWISVALVMAPPSTMGMAIVRSASVSDASVAPSRRRDCTYADGIYTATGKYGSLPSSITVTVTLVGGVITAVKVRPHATNPTSLDFQRRFAAAVPAVAVGKPIDEVKVGRLAGSSGTPDGFNAAIRRIEEQARKCRTTAK